MVASTGGSFWPAGVGLVGATATAGTLAGDVWPLLSHEDLLPGPGPDVQLTPHARQRAEDRLAFVALGDNGCGWPPGWRSPSVWPSPIRRCRMVWSPCWATSATTARAPSTNLGGWLTTVVGRICLDMLRSRSSRRVASLDTRFTDPAAAGRTPTRRRWWPKRLALPCWWCSTGCHRLSRWRSCCTTCSRCRSTRSPPLWSVRWPPPRSWPVAPATGSGVRLRRPTPTSPGTATWSTPSSPPPAPATSPGCWRCWHPMSSGEPTWRSYQRACPPSFVAPGKSPRRPWATPPAPGSRSQSWSTRQSAPWWPPWSPGLGAGVHLRGRPDRDDRGHLRPRAAPRPRSVAACQLTGGHPGSRHSGRHGTRHPLSPKPTDRCPTEHQHPNRLDISRVRTGFGRYDAAWRRGSFQFGLT